MSSLIDNKGRDFATFPLKVERNLCLCTTYTDSYFLTLYPHAHIPTHTCTHAHTSTTHMYPYTPTTPTHPPTHTPTHTHRHTHTHTTHTTRVHTSHTHHTHTTHVHTTVAAFSFYQFYCFQDTAALFNRFDPNSTTVLEFVNRTDVERISALICSQTAVLREFINTQLPWFQYQEWTWLGVGREIRGRCLECSVV